MSRGVRTELHDLLGSLPTHDLPPERARVVLTLATRALAEGTASESWKERLGRWWNRGVEPAFLTAVSASWLAWVAVQMAALAR